MNLHVIAPPSTERSWMAAIDDQLAALKLLDELMRSGLRDVRQVMANWRLDHMLVKSAAPFAWSRETTQAAWTASTSIPEDTAFNTWNLPGSAAWWRFDEPLPIQTVNHDPSGGLIGDKAFQEAGIRAFAFGWIEEAKPITRIPAGTPTWILDKVLRGEVVSTRRAVGISTWIDDPLYKTNRTRLSPSQTWWWREGETLKDMLIRVRIEHQQVYGPGGPWEHKPQVGVDVFMMAAEQISRFILSGMAWLNQQVLVDCVEKVERHRRKDFNRQTGQDLSGVRVVNLRRSERHDSDEALSDEDRRTLTVRFVVNGHWRNQACGPKQSERRLLYINPYIKGPDDAPMQAPKPVVYRVAR